jgi:uncharacterized membrane protein YcfT
VAAIGRGRDGAERVAFVDYAKGLCIVMVVMMHSTLGVEKAAGAEGWLHHAVAFAMPFRMPDFFLISGLFLANVIDRDWRSYLDRKVLHFAYFYALWVVIQWAMKAVGPALLSGDWGGVGAALVSALWDPPGTLWFIYILPIFFVVAKLLRRAPPALVLGVAALLQVMPHEMGWYIGQEFCERFVFFLGGAYAARHVFAFAALVDRNRGRAATGLAAWALVNGALVAAGLAALPGIGLLLGFAGALAVITLAVILSRLPGTAALRFCGERSIVIYLAFFVPMASLRTLLLGFGPLDDLGTIALLVTAASVVTPLLMHRLVRGTPLRVLFERPAAFRLEGQKPRPALVPAE